MTIFKTKLFLFFSIIVCFHQSYADEKLISGTISCSAEWNELCEDKKIISVPEHYRLCHHQIVIAEKNGEASHQVVASDQSSITVYFRAKGNQDRHKPAGASIKLGVDLSGVKESETCEDVAPVQAVEIPAPTPPNDSEVAKEMPAPTPEPEPKPVDAAMDACACSQWLNWMKVERCLTQEKRADRPSCDSYEVTIQCVTSKEECRSIQKDSCAQVVGLNQSTSLKRLFVENSPYCQK